MPNSGRISAKTLFKDWQQEPRYREAYNNLESELGLASQIIEARTRAKLTQAELAAIMQTSQTTIIRLESGKARPSTTTLARIAKATKHKLAIHFIPIDNERP